MRTVAIIQARMQSTRLPGKVLADVAGAPLLMRVVERAQRASLLDAVVVATSEAEADDCIARFCQEHSLQCFRGSEGDVLDRYHEAALHFNAEVIVRLTADCPLLDPLVIDRVVQTFSEGSVDYVSNTLECTYPDGLDTEVFSRDCLARARRLAQMKSEREHVTAYIVKHPESFALGGVRNAVNLSHMRWTVDEPEDLEFVRAIYLARGPDSFGMAEVLALLHAQPSLSKINAGFARNQGYQESLSQDLRAASAVSP